MARAHSSELPRAGAFDPLELARRVLRGRKSPQTPVASTVTVEFNNRPYPIKALNRFGQPRDNKTLEWIARGQWTTEAIQRIKGDMTPASLESLHERFPKQAAVLDRAKKSAVSENEDPSKEGPREWMEGSWARANVGKPPEGSLLIRYAPGDRQVYFHNADHIRDFEAFYRLLNTPSDVDKYRNHYPAFLIHYFHPLLDCYEISGCRSGEFDEYPDGFDELGKPPVAF